MSAADPTITEQPAPAYPIAYPIPQPEDDHRFCYGLGIDTVLAQHGYPPVRTGTDLARIMNALFRLIYQETQP